MASVPPYSQPLSVGVVGRPTSYLRNIYASFGSQPEKTSLLGWFALEVSTLLRWCDRSKEKEWTFSFAQSWGCVLPGGIGLFERIEASRRTEQKPHSEWRGVSMTYCRKRGLDGPAEPDVSPAPGWGSSDIVRLMAHGVTFTIGACGQSSWS